MADEPSIGFIELMRKAIIDQDMDFLKEGVCSLRHSWRWRYKSTKALGVMSGVLGA